MEMQISVVFWFGRFMVLLAGLLEFFLGNTFACTLFFGFGKLGFWISNISADISCQAVGFFTYTTTLQPFYGARLRLRSATMHNRLGHRKGC